MKIQLTHVIPALDWGDESFQLSELVVALRDQAISSRILTLDPHLRLPSALQASDVEVLQRRLRSRFDLPALMRLAHDLRNSGGVIQTWSSASEVVGWLWRLGCRPMSWIVTTVGGAPPSILAREASIGQLSIQCDVRGPAPVASGAGCRNDLCEYCGYSLSPPTPGHDPAAMRSALRAALNLPPHCRLVGTATAHGREDRLKDAIWAADLLKVVRDDVHLIVIGDGPQRWRWQRFRDCVQIADRVHFWSPATDPRPYIECLDCYWSVGVSRRLGWGAMCALAAGIPIVASRVGEQFGILTDVEGGCLINPGDRAELVRMTIRILDDPRFADRVGNSAKQQFEQARRNQQLPAEIVATWINRIVSLK